MRTLVIEGNIAAGKSTLCRRVVEKAGDNSIVALYENVNDAFLKLFYRDKARYAFAFQLHMYESRSNGTRLRINAAAATKECNVILLDRGIVGDFVFAVTNYITGAMTRNEMEVYMSLVQCNHIEDCWQLLEGEYGTEESDWEFVYLHSDYRACRERVENKRKTCEKGVVDLWYYEVLEQVYFNALLYLRHAYGNRIRVSLEDDYFQDADVLNGVFKLQGKSPPELDIFSSSSEFEQEFRFLEEQPASSREIPEKVRQDRMLQIGVEWYSRSFRRNLFNKWANKYTATN